MSNRIPTLIRPLLLFAWLALNPVFGVEPLHVRIDQLIAKTHVGPTAPLSSDAEFLRRAYLDFTGTIPSVEVAREFLADAAPDKRAALIDRLLGDPRMVRHLANVFDVMLMERRADKHVKAAEWQAYLEQSLAANKPFSQLAAELLGADGSDEKLRAPVKFLIDRELEPSLLTREVSRMFLGRDIECAQCHDHPLIGDYLQADYYGLYAFVQRSYLFQPDPKKPAVIAEKADGDASYKSVFTDESGVTRPRLPGGAQIDEPTFAKGEEWQVAPDPKDKNVRPIPKYSRRAQLAKLATDGTNDAFNQNIANRLWAHLLGRGLVHPVDLHHSANPPTHPELLEVLGDEFAAMKFEIKAFLREIALSQTYQRSFYLSEDLAPHVTAAQPQLPGRQAELVQMTAAIDNIKQSLAAARESLNQAKTALTPLPAELAKAVAATAESQKQFDEMSQALAPLQVQLAQKQQLAEPLTQALAKAAEAAGKLPDDQELAAVVTTLRTRSQSVSTELAAMTNMVVEKTNAANAARTKLDADKKVSDELTSKFELTKKQIDESQKSVLEHVSQLDIQQLALAGLNKQIEMLTALLNFGEKLAANNTNAELVARLRFELGARRNELEIVQVGLLKSQTDLAAAQTDQAAATKTLTDMNGQLASKQELAALIAQAAERTEVARQKQPEDVELVAAATTIKAQADRFTGATAELQKSVATQGAALQAATDRMSASQTAIVAANAQIAAIGPGLAPLELEFEQANAANVALDSAYVKVTDLLGQRFALATIQPLSPEQLAWSVLQASGTMTNQRIAAAAEINTKTPLSPDDEKDSAKIAQRANEIEQATYDRLKGNVARFVQLFAAAPGQPQGDFFATVDQALFFANGGELRSWLAPNGENLTARLMKIEDPRAIADEMYLGVLTRQPTDAEVNDVTQYLASRPNEKAAAVQEMVWALMASIEFRFQH